MSQATLAISKDRLAALLAKVRAGKAQTTSINPVPASVSPLLPLIGAYGKHGEAITYNSEQQEFISLASEGRSCILIGSAGTGKTTCMMGAIGGLMQSGNIPIISDTDAHKYLVQGTPGIIATSYTRRAVSNLRKAMPAGMEGACITIHKLLEYQPVYYEVTDPETGDSKNTMRFEPTRHQMRPLPATIKCIIIDEASMVSVELFRQLVSALPHEVQFIFVGDIQQLPPVFGSAILGFKMLELPTVELTQVYRTAGTIIKWATDIKEGRGFAVPDKVVEQCEYSKLTLHPWKKKITGEVACLTFCKFITTAFDHGKYNPDTDCILIPFNKAFGTDEINKRIGNHIAKREERLVWEVIAGFNKLYFSVGDKVLYDKEDATITRIVRNGSYCGRAAQTESVTLDYWGYDSVQQAERQEDSTNIDFMLDQVAAYGTNDDDERVRAASHIITVTLTDTEQEIEITTSGDLNLLLLYYASTVHKAQGSEWDKVFFVLHQSHATMCQRELLYTGFTRAAKELYVLCEPDTFVKGVASQRIKGDTLAEKAEYFKGKVDSNGGY